MEPVHYIDVQLINLCGTSFRWPLSVCSHHAVKSKRPIDRPERITYVSDLSFCVFLVSYVSGVSLMVIGILCSCHALLGTKFRRCVCKFSFSKQNFPPHEFFLLDLDGLCEAVETSC